MNPLYTYSQAAQSLATTKKQVYDTSDETYYFIKTMFEWKHPERSTYQGEKCCIVLIRKQAEKPQEVKQIWLKTYLTKKNGKEYAYTNNFSYITAVLKNLASMQGQGNFNIFMAYCTFRKGEAYKRTKVQALRAQAIAIDLDFNKLQDFAGLSYEESIEKIRDSHADIFNKFNPMVIRSGGGCQLYFSLTMPLLLSYKKFDEEIQDIDAQEKFALISRKLNTAFESAGADTHCKGDSARIFRVPGVYSLKYDSPRLVSVTEKGKAATQSGLLNYLQKCIPEENKSAPKAEAKKLPTPKKATIKVSKPTVFRDDNELLGQRGVEYLVSMRLRDLEKAIEQRHDVTGFRNQIIFIAAIILSTSMHNTNDILNYLQSINAHFKEPLPLEELKSTVNSATSKLFKVTNEYIFQTLYLQLGTDLSKLEGKYTAEDKRAAKAKHNAARPHKKAYSKTEKLAFLQIHCDMSNAELAAMLLCSTKTIKRLRMQWNTASVVFLSNYDESWTFLRYIQI